MLNIIDIKQAEEYFSEIIEQTAGGNEVIITKKGKPLVKLTAVSEKHKKKRQFGSAKDFIRIADDFDDPLEDFRAYLKNSYSCPAQGAASQYIQRKLYHD